MIKLQNTTNTLLFTLCVHLSFAVDPSLDCKLYVELCMSIIVHNSITILLCSPGSNMNTLHHSVILVNHACNVISCGYVISCIYIYI